MVIKMALIKEFKMEMIMEKTKERITQTKMETTLVIIIRIIMVKIKVIFYMINLYNRKK